GDKQLDVLVMSLGSKNARSDIAECMIKGLAAGWPTNRTVKFEVDVDRPIAQLMAKLPAASRGRILKLASTWGVKGIDTQLAEITKAAFATLADVKAKDADRLAAAQQIIEFRPDSDEAARAIVDAVTPQTSPALLGGLFEALGQSKAKGVGVAVVGKLK